MFVPIFDTFDISPVVVIQQVGRRPYLIFDFTWSGLNEATKRLPPMEAMRFGGELYRILKKVLMSDPRLGPVYLSKVGLDDAYMRLWARMEDTLSVTFLTPKKPPSNQQLVGFHLSLPMGYVDSAPYFYMATEMVADLANEAIAQRDAASTHPLDQAPEAISADNSGTMEAQYEASWEQLLAEQLSDATDSVDV